MGNETKHFMPTPSTFANTLGIIGIPGEWILVDLGSVGHLSRLLTLSFFEIMLKPFFR
jgi:hypothetical protein